MSDLVFFNAADGYAEAILRGYRKGILGEQAYTALRNTKNSKDIKAVSYLLFNALGPNGYGLL